MYGSQSRLCRFTSSSVGPRQTTQVCPGKHVMTCAAASYSLIAAQDYAIDATKGVEYALKQIGGEGVDATLMATDALPAYEYGLRLTRKHGTFIVIGQ